MLISQKVNATIPYTASYEESTLLLQLGIKVTEIQPLCNYATEVCWIF